MGIASIGSIEGCVGIAGYGRRARVVRIGVGTVIALWLTSPWALSFASITQRASDASGATSKQASHPSDASNWVYASDGSSASWSSTASWSSSATSDMRATNASESAP
jgi:hypothetical protein